MKKAVKLTALSLALVSSVAMADDNIGFVNVDYLIINHPTRPAELEKFNAEIKAPLEKLKNSEKALQEKKMSFEKEIEGKVKALEKDAKKLRQADIKKRQDEINKLAEKRNAELNALVAEHQKNVAKFDQDNQKRDHELTKRFLNDIAEATKKVAKEKNFTAVLEERNAVYIADGKNITQDVLKALPAPAKAK